MDKTRTLPLIRSHFLEEVYQLVLKKLPLNLCLRVDLGASNIILVDFERVLKALLAGFDYQQIRYAAIGGFALGVLGIPRATMDLDFLVQRDDLHKLQEF